MDYRKKFIVEPDGKLRLSHIDPDFTGDEKSAATAAEATAHYLKN